MVLKSQRIKAVRVKPRRKRAVRVIFNDPIKDNDNYILPVEDTKGIHTLDDLYNIEYEVAAPVKESIVEMLELFKEQKKAFKKSIRRLNIWHGPVRSGKTISSILKWIHYIGTAPKGDLIMTGKTNGTLYRNVIRPMQEFLGDDMLYIQRNDGRVIEIWGREIFCFGANDERAEQKIRGMTVAGCYGDEVSLWPESYFTMMLSRMSVAGAKAFLTTNPDNPNHWLKTKYIEREDELDMKVFHWPIESNIFLPIPFIEALKKEYVGLWYRRFILGEWCAAEGAIYDFFDKKLHCGKNMPKAIYYIGAIDYGTNNPFTYGLFGVNPNATPQIWLEDEYWWDSKVKGKQKTDAEYSDDIKEFLGDRAKVVRNTYIDPSAASFELQMRRDGFTGIRHAINDVLPGIRTVSRMLKNGEYMIHRRCRHAIKEYYGYVWDEQATSKKGEDKPLKQSDHSMDMQRYALHSLYGEITLDYGLLNAA